MKKVSEDSDILENKKGSKDCLPGKIHFDDDDELDGGKTHTFRERRLTYTKNSLLETINVADLQNLETSSQEDDDGDGDGDHRGEEDKAEDADDRKIQAEVILSSPSIETTITASLSSTGTAASAAATLAGQLESRIQHASAPPIPTECSKRKAHFLYVHRNKDNNEQDADPENLPLSPSESESESKKHKQSNPSPNKREEGNLPFPQNIVGTYSCHGVEPVYDDDNLNTNTPSCIAKINQDRGGVAFPYANCNRTAVFAVYDGHGEGGEFVAQFALHEIPRRLEKHEEFLKGNIERAFKDVFISVDKDLNFESGINPLYSGCTACVALLKNNILHLSNAGDSRAVMAYRTTENNNTTYQALDLTVDQNPDSPGEQERIEGLGGFVSPPPEEGLSARVWLDCNYSQIGLAMSRSIGDHAVKKIGVIAEPEISIHELRDEDDFMIIATDGVWEFVSSQQAVDIVAKDLENGLGSSVACQHLIEAAAAMWHENEGDYRDDITALVVKVKELWKNE